MTWSCEQIGDSRSCKVSGESYRNGAYCEKNWYEAFVTLIMSFFTTFLCFLMSSVVLLVWCVNLKRNRKVSLREYFLPDRLYEKLFKIPENEIEMNGDQLTALDTRSIKSEFVLI